MGRPLGFAPDDKLKAAMRLFWTQGYEATSVQDLVDRLGINRFSLYNTFGDKHQLFLAALEHYGDTVMAALLAPLEAPDAGLAAIHGYLDRLARALSGPGGDWGCLLQNAALERALDDDQVQALVKHRLDRLESLLYQALRRARSRGELRSDRELKACARFILTHCQGAITLRKTCADPEAAAQTLKFLKQETARW